MCASINKGKQIPKRPLNTMNSARKTSIPTSARTVKSARGEESEKNLNDHSRPIANFQAPTAELKKDLNSPHVSPKPHVVVKKDLPVKHAEDKKADDKDKKDLKKVKKPEGKGFFSRIVQSVKCLFRSKA